MLDFMRVGLRSTKEGSIEVYPNFLTYRKQGKSSDLMIRGGDFYAVWNEAAHLWSTDESVALYLIDRELDEYAAKHEEEHGIKPRILHMWDGDSGMIDKWHKYVKQQLRDSYQPLDESIIFADTETVRTDYASKKLKYSLNSDPTPAYNELISTLYDDEERLKLEWAIGSIVHGDSKNIQKFVVLYGAGGTGKSTILNIILDLFDGYCSTFDSKALGSSNAAFALEAFKSNPLVAVQQDGDLSGIEDNTRINSLVSHEEMTVNEKFKSAYTARFNSFIFMGTNKPVRITDAKSGIIRRLIDVTPSGRLVPKARYDILKEQVKFELGGIAKHCEDVYLENCALYDDYIPVRMMGATNDFYNFMIDDEVYDEFLKKDETTLHNAWELYSKYCDRANVRYKYSQRIFKEELRNYFREFHDRGQLKDGTRVRSHYVGLLREKFEFQDEKSPGDILPETWLRFDKTESLFDTLARDFPAQLAKEDGTPNYKWENVKTTLSEIDCHKLHFVKAPENHIIIDFDISDRDGNKSLARNIKEASKWPQTYAELSRSGCGIHLHYIYDGDVSQLSRVYDDQIEVKVFNGNSSLRRKLTLCNDIPIGTIRPGYLPIKEGSKTVNFEGVKNEKALRTIIKRALNKEYEPHSTACSIDLIYKALEQAYADGIRYDVSKLENVIWAFACNSTHQSDRCRELVRKMHFKSADFEEHEEKVEEYETDELIFFDVEVFPNLFIIVWKPKEKPGFTWINPSPEAVQSLCRHKLIGFNNRKYDNHILYARGFCDYTIEAIYELSQRLVSAKKGDNSVYFGEAYNLSYADIYDISTEKQSLKKFEIALGIHHMELGYRWDEPVPEEKWQEVADYCMNDVIATEAVWDSRRGDIAAREILAEIAGGIVNDTSNSLSGKFIFEGNKNPQSAFNWRDLSKPVGWERYEEYRVKFGESYRFRVFDTEGLPQYRDYIPGEKLPDGWSILPFWPRYYMENFKSYYAGPCYREDPLRARTDEGGREVVGEGGKVYSEPGMYIKVLADDVASMHPHSATAEVIFGPYFTARFNDIIEARVAIKHKDFEKVKGMFGGKLAKYVEDPSIAKDLAQALKIVINSVYGLTSAKFPNLFKSPENVDNIVAKRGALFMTMLKEEVQKRGYQVCHIKTDCIKVPNYTDDIHEFIVNFGKEFGYDFEIEDIYDKFCLVNDAVYVAKFNEPEKDENGNDIWWSATGTQFAVPYVFKTLFSHEPIIFQDLCETKTVQTAMYLDMNEHLPEDEHSYRFVGKAGQFCPMKPGAGGGILLRENGDKYSAVTGTKGYRWMESEMVKTLGREDSIDRSYYISLVDDAVAAISKYGDAEWFLA